ncbi:DsbE family thiol:disulfide interchange protein [Cellvibrio polysaccharolyticus]|uniref:DsbE family thiol:disulfide interchange protein n=1 Tax=Cellvibrio polysaccharolyticus TaxID=2082724 RepID=A0A928YTY4_9GAMM|nr:DsbE family thiol:disulfide interchange protein [Cellvibrio polysaccharolyticus]MBE8717479.1 DsbE family thiol:disulfide interchange protein [Cellvibrio polysaccharolyticus]
MIRQRIKLFIPLAVFVVLGILFWQGLKLDPTAMPSALLDKPVPVFSLPSLEDPEKPVTRDIFKGKTSLMNVWATWCPTCYAEHAYLVKLAEQGIPIVGVNYKDDVPAAQRWLRELHNPYIINILDADGRFGIDLGVYGAPETYVVDENGVIRYKHVGVVDQQVWDNDLKVFFE